MAALKKAFVTTETYATDWENFYVDITTFESRFWKEFEAHIYHRDYDTKMHMFGALYEHESYESFLEMVELCSYLQGKILQRRKQLKIKEVLADDGENS